MDYRIKVTATKDISLKEKWKAVFKSSSKRSVLISGLILLIGIAFILPVFFNKVQKVKGVVLHDRLLATIPSHNVSIAIFSIIWGMSFLAFYRAIYRPSVVLIFIWTLIFVCVARMISISLVPLDPPAGLIPLSDPVTGIFYGESNITKDLFFSGHTATVTLMFLCLQKKTDKIVAFTAIIVLAVLLLVQHVHYTIDILAAPLIVYSLFRLTRFLLRIS